jgi:hypothetical protein
MLAARIRSVYYAGAPYVQNNIEQPLPSDKFKHYGKQAGRYKFNFV